MNRGVVTSLFEWHWPSVFAICSGTVYSTTSTTVYKNPDFFSVVVSERKTE